MSEVQWFYSDRGQRKGPVTETVLKELVKGNQLAQDTMVWRKGLTDWVPLRHTALVEIISDVPPPLKAQRVLSVWVWLIAIFPWMVTGVCATVDLYREQDAILIVTLFVSTALVVLDVNALRAAGYPKPSYWWCCLPFILHPAYLYARSRSLNADKAPVLISCASVSATFLIAWMQSR